MITPDMVQTIIQHKMNGQIYVFKNFCTVVPDWQTFIDYLDQTPPIGDSVVKGTATIRNMNMQWSLPLYDYIGDNSKNIETSISNAFGLTGELNNIFVNFSTVKENVANHQDPYDNFYWQCIGSTEWISNDILYRVDSGDLVYIPAQCPHIVNFIMPRAAIGYSWDLGKSELLRN